MPPYWIPAADGALRATELLSGIETAQLTVESLGRSHDEAEVIWPTTPFAIVVSQDCDLDWDYKARQQIAQLGNPPARGSAREDWNLLIQKARAKLMRMVVLCEATLSVEVRKQSGLKTQQWNWARRNQNERYQFLRPVAADVDREHEGVGEMVLDFKRYLAMPIEELQRRIELSAESPGSARRRAMLESPYKEEVLARFYSFQGRVAVPEAMAEADVPGADSSEEASGPADT